MDEMVDQEPEIIRHLRGIRRVVINACHGGFSLSHAAIMRYHELQGQKIYFRTTEYADILLYHLDPANPTASSWSDRDVPRDDPYLVRVVEEMGGEAAGGLAAMLKVVEIPESVAWHIEEYDGLEWVAENHRTWS
jgi:hypothetical protein